ncbi:glycosyltransferase family 39 protein [Actinoplanes sp. NPDC051861]|uniref:ArnT family glycosyltransferase n=1 Tax=Actinoplanes sp. NPDC051861 TaxID=3155170 RepID=UPI00343CF351
MSHGVLQTRLFTDNDGPVTARPGLARAAVGLVVAAAAVVYAWGITSVQMHVYYAPAVRSMSSSWRALLFGGFDPDASITLDKLPGAFQVQALSARVFGFHVWSLMLPQVVAALVSVVVLHLVVRRWLGPVAGVLAAVLLATTPVLAALAHSQIADALLVMLLLLAADAAQRSALTGRLWLLLLAGAWLGLAFQVKMLQAWLVLPALVVGYALGAPGPARRRWGHLGLAGLVMLAVSSWQIVLFAVTGSRPYVDASTDDSLLSMILGYNLFGRFGVSGGGTVSTGAGAAGPPAGLLHTVVHDVAPQVTWSLPLAIAGLVLGVSAWRRSRDVGCLVWGLWLVAHMAAFSTGQVSHSYYVVAAAPALAALGAAGIVRLWRGRASRPWLLPAILALTVVWDLYLIYQFPGFHPWLGPVVAITGLAAVVLLTVRAATARAGLATGLVAVLLAPVVWSVSTGDARFRGTSAGPHAGPPAASTEPVPDGQAARRIGDWTTAETDALRTFLRGQHAGEKYLVAVQGSVNAGPLVLAGESVLPMGGFTGSTPFPGQAGLAEMVQRGDVRYVLFVPGRRETTLNPAISTWVASACHPAGEPQWGLSDCRPAAGA